MKAVWKGKTIAQSNKTIIIEGNHYFPPQSVNRDYLRESSKSTVCPWKGKAAYKDLIVGDEINKDAAWYYPRPSARAKQIKGYIAFWRGVEISDEERG